MLTYVVCHLSDHVLLLISIPFADAAHRLLIDPWKTTPGTALLLTAILAHYANALWSITIRRTLVMPRWGRWQLGLGLSIPLILLLHLSGTRISEAAWGVGTDYSSVLLRIWVLAPWRGALQVVLLSIVWLHASIGIHYWLRNLRWYDRVRPALAVAALLLPVLALAGFVSGGNELEREAGGPGYVAREAARAHITPEATAAADRVALLLILAHVLLVGAAFGARALRRRLGRGKRLALLTHSGGRTVRVARGATVLEALNEERIPHASVCGGRARCTTCRVRVLKGLAALPPPAPLEAAALARIGAPDDVRLACQIRPAADLSIVPLLSPSARPADGFGKAGSAGTEQCVTVMFVDLRESTRLSELLDQFFEEMSAALAATGGHFSQFTGDGLMALFGLDGADERAAARAALASAAEMKARLRGLNARLLPDLGEPLRIGIGIHLGEAIVGPLGPPGSQILTAIGDTVNTAARIEALSKAHGGATIVSRRAAEAAACEVGGAPVQVATISGRVEPIEYYALAESAGTR